MKNSIIFTLPMIWILSCNTTQNKSFELTTSQCLDGKIGKLIGLSLKDSKKTLETNYFVVNTNIEEEGESWPALTACNSSDCSSPLLIAETSWIDKEHIQRISIMDGHIRIHADSIYIGMPFLSLKNIVSEDMPSSPDGYFFVRDKYCTQISYELQMEPADSALYYGTVDKLNEIPEQAFVSRIIINALKID